MEVQTQYVTEAFFFLHTVNAFEADNHLIIDICCYANGEMLDCMYIEALKVSFKYFKWSPLHYYLSPRKLKSITQYISK